MGFGGSKSNNGPPAAVTTPVAAPSDDSVTRTPMATQVQRADANPSPQLLSTPQAATDDEMRAKQARGGSGLG